MKAPKLWEIAVILGIVAVLALLFSPAGNSKNSARRTACLSNLKQLAIASIMYSADFNDRFPNRDTWRDSVQSYTKARYPLVCLTISKEKNPQLYGYAFNGKLSNTKSPPQAQTVPLIFDSINLARNASGDLTSLPYPGRHPSYSSKHGSNNIAYADGHAKYRAVE